MDLGFGGSNQIIGTIAANALLQSAHVQEEQLSNEIQNYDTLLNDVGGGSGGTTIEQIRKQRIQQLQKEQEERKTFLLNGHGMYTELQTNTDVAKEFFDITKKSNRVVVHFYKSSSAHVCDVLHKHLSTLARKHIETKFIKINCESVMASDGLNTNNGVTFLVEKLGISVMPTLLLIQNRKTIHTIPGYNELGGMEQVTSKLLSKVLKSHGIINDTDDNSDDDEEEQNDDDKKNSFFRKVSSNKYGGSRNDRRGIYDDQDDDDE